MNARTSLYATLLCTLAAGEAIGLTIAGWDIGRPLWLLLLFAAIATGNALFAWMFARRLLRWLPA